MAIVIDALRSEVFGSVLVDGDSGYDRERSGWNLANQYKPDVVVVPATPHDVVVAVNFARESKRPIAVQGAGHGMTVLADEGVLINTRRLAGVDIDKDRRVASVHAGTPVGAVLEASAEHGLAPLMGSSTTVSAVGYLTGGGLPILGRTFGYAADHVRALEMVTPDGQRRKVTSEYKPDLFWAVRGGGCNFGVVTTAEIDLLSLPTVYGGQLIFPGESAAAVVHTWVEWCRLQPDEMNSSLGLMRVPDVPVFPSELRGRFMVFVRIAYTGPKAEGEYLTAPLRVLGPEQVILDELPISRLPEIPADPTDPLPIADRAFKTHDLDVHAIEKIIELAGPKAENPPTLCEVRHMGAALSKPPPVPNAVGRRDAVFTVNLPTVVAQPADVVRANQVHSETVEALRPWRMGGPHANFISTSGVAEGEVAESYDEVDYVRLQEIKRRWDPDNLFRLNRNIPPA